MLGGRGAKGQLGRGLKEAGHEQKMGCNKGRPRALEDEEAESNKGARPRVRGC